MMDYPADYYEDNRQSFRFDWPRQGKFICIAHFNKAIQSALHKRLKALRQSAKETPYKRTFKYN